MIEIKIKRLREEINFECEKRETALRMGKFKTVSFYDERIKKLNEKLNEYLELDNGGRDLLLYS